jgi:hypothetical protein
LRLQQQHLVLVDLGQANYWDNKQFIVEFEAMGEERKRAKRHQHQNISAAG